MVNDSGERDALANALARFTQLTLRTQDEEGTTREIRPSFRAMERATGIPHQRLSDFMRNPQGASAALTERVRAAMDNPAANIPFRGENVYYVNAPRFTRQVLENMRLPAGAQSFRIVVHTDETGYKGYRSSEWFADLDNMAEIAEGSVGGYEAIERIVFDVGE